MRPDRTYDFDSLHAIARLAVLTTNAILDRSSYPNDICTQSVANTRAIGVGVQGLADAFMISELSFNSSGARQLNREIFEAIYHAAYDASCELAERDGPYPLYPNSPAARGVLQHDMWADVVLSGRYDFDALRDRVLLHGLRNSMLTTQMPTASTAKLLGNFDATEPYTRCASPTAVVLCLRRSLIPRSNVITHRVLSGDYTEVCPWLVSSLTSRGLWTEDIRVEILRRHGASPVLLLGAESRI